MRILKQAGFCFWKMTWLPSCHSFHFMNSFSSSLGLSLEVNQLLKSYSSFCLH